MGAEAGVAVGDGRVHLIVRVAIGELARAEAACTCAATLAPLTAKEGAAVRSIGAEESRKSGKRLSAGARQEQAAQEHGHGLERRASVGHSRSSRSGAIPPSDAMRSWLARCAAARRARPMAAAICVLPDGSISSSRGTTCWSGLSRSECSRSQGASGRPIDVLRLGGWVC